MNNPLKILSTLDRNLSQRLELNLYGRSAIALGFEASKGFDSTLDIDIIIPEVELEVMDANEDFWKAVEATNKELAPEGLYVTHLFVDRQIILRKNWMSERVLLDVPNLVHIRAMRPSVQDLVLSKTMRVDPEDRNDIRFLSQQSSLRPYDWTQVFDAAVIPPILEIQEAFSNNKDWFFKEVCK